jgi:hypothetical protein
MFYLIIGTFVSSSVFAQSADKPDTPSLQGNNSSPETTASEDTLQKMAHPVMSHKISFFSGVDGTLGDLAPLMADRWGFHLAYENNLAGIIPQFLATFLHSARLEIGYSGYTASDSISLIRIEAGPEWFITPWPAKYGRFQLGLLPGMSWISIQTGGQSTGAIEGVSFSASVLAGYEFDFAGISTNNILSHVFLFLHARAGYVYDTVTPWTGIGGAFGAGWRF